MMGFACIRKNGVGEKRGFVLVVVLWLLAILTVIAIGFQRRSVMEARAAAFTLDHSKAMFLARGAVARGVIEVRNKGAIDALYKQSGRTGYSQQWTKTKDMFAEGSYYTVPEGDEYKEEICKYVIRDEESRVSVNSAPEDMLKEVKSLSLEAVRHIMKRRMGDADAKEPAQPFQTIEELREAADIKDKDWFGSGRKAPLKDIITCWGDGKLNVNTASADVLASVPGLRSNAVSAIVDYRAGQDRKLCTEDDLDFESFDDLRERTGVTGDALNALQQYCKLDSQFFTITGIATLRQGKVVATCVATVVIDEGATTVMKWREEIVES
jgi:general secretion pathway protein K